MDIAALFRQAPVEQLETPYQGKLLQRVQQEFNKEEQELFVASFYCYLNHHPTQDFVVDLDGVWQWLGYSRKACAKRKLQQSFEEDSDYRLLHTEVQQTTAGRGGHNREVIMMTVECFKSMCQLSETDKGRRVRKYYLRLEALLHELLEEQSRDLAHQLRAQSTRADQLQQRVDQHDMRRRAVEVRGQAVYILGDDDPTRHKLGKADNVDNRERTAGTFNPTGMMRHAVPCVNAILLETLLKHRLRRRRIPSARTGNDTEWFTMNLDEAIATVEEAREWLDEGDLGGTVAQSEGEVTEAMQAAELATHPVESAEDQDAGQSISQPPRAAQPAQPAGRIVRRRLRLTVAEREATRGAADAAHAAYVAMEARLAAMQQSINALVTQVQHGHTSEQATDDEEQPAPPTGADPGTQPEQRKVTVKFTIPDLKNKRAVQYNLDGSFVKSWDTAVQAAKSGLFGNGAYTNIRAAIRGEATHAAGFVWRHEDNVIEKEVEYRTDGAYRQLRHDGSLVTTYTSVQLACKAAGVGHYVGLDLFASKKPFKGYSWVTDRVIESIKPRPRKIRKKASEAVEPVRLTM